ncbi:class F sortase [Candidatus Saccharibacteria bacterium]|nr:class F sortase [Candidatus Saccharibacteria bacterium]
MTILAMSLRLGNRRDIIRWAIWSVLAILFLIFLLRVVTFENTYYAEKEGSERAVVEKQEEEEVEEEELIEEPPTETEVYEYIVAPDHPRYLTIERLGIRNARILTMGVNNKGELDTPRNIFDVGWYEGSDKPGQGGTMVIDGHNGGPHVHGVFKDLPALVVGDVIKVERGDGVVFNYKVIENKAVLLSDSNAYMSEAMDTPEKGKESVTLITCTGEWSDRQQTYLSRQFTRAILVD